MTRKIYRHESNKGSVIEFDFYDRPMRLFVPDAAYRPSGKFNFISCDQVVSELKHFKCDVYDHHVRPHDNNLEPIVPQSDISLQFEFPSFKEDKTAKENTDILVKYNSEAANACRNTDVGLGPMDLPNIYEMMVVYQEADTLDAMDLTFNDNKDKGLGHTSTYGRFNWLNCGAVWSSTLFSNTRVRTVSYFGAVAWYESRLNYGVIPVKEL